MDLTSADLPPLVLEDHVLGEAGALTVVYMDLACPMCALQWPQIRARGGRIAFRHFPLGSRRPRAPALHAAAEAAALQRPSAFFEMVDSIYADHSHQDDPHLWARIEALGLDLARFDSDRHSEAVAARVRRDFVGGMRAGVIGAPALFALP